METNYDALIQASADELFQQMSSKEDQKNIDRLRAAFEFAREAHSPQRRKSGEPYIIHPVNVARIVAQELELGADPVIAAFLHDVVEDAGITLDEVEARFGKRVRELVESETENKRSEIPAIETWRLRKEESLEVLKNLSSTSDSL